MLLLWRSEWKCLKKPPEETNHSCFVRIKMASRCRLYALTYCYILSTLPWHVRNRLIDASIFVKRKFIQFLVQSEIKLRIFCMLIPLAIAVTVLFRNHRILNLIFASPRRLKALTAVALMMVAVSISET
jgi:hypothetical protein